MSEVYHTYSATIRAVAMHHKNMAYLVPSSPLWTALGFAILSGQVKTPLTVIWATFSNNSINLYSQLVVGMGIL